MYYPTKSMNDYQTEMNRLFSRIDENEYLSTPHTNQSYSQYLRSSSSTDTSPESFPDVNRTRELFPVGPGFLSPAKPDQSPAQPYQGFLRLGDNHQFDNLSTSSDVDFILPQPLYETPLGKYDRPILGRQIISENKFDNTKTIYEELQQQTPPKSKRQFYELFPAENRIESQPTNLQNWTPPKVDFNSNFDFKYRKSNNRPRFNMSNDTTTFDAMSNDTTTFDVMSNDTTTFDVMSNEASLFDTMSMDGSLYHQMSNYYFQNVSPMTSPVRCRSNSTQSLQKVTPFKEPLITLSTSKNGNKLCTLCRKNGETPLVYTTHKVKEKVGGRNVVTCPILRSHICSACGATGDDAHTISYCPLLRRSNNGQPLPSTTVSLKSTRIKSNGMVRRRY